jgi:hypothetical protein
LQFISVFFKGGYEHLNDYGIDLSQTYITEHEYPGSAGVQAEAYSKGLWFWGLGFSEI